MGDQTDPVSISVPLTYIDGPHTARLRDGRFLDFRRGEAERPEISIPISENEREHLLLLFIPHEASYRVLKIHTPPGAIRGGDRYLINATETRLAIKLGENRPVVVDAGNSGVIRGPGGRDITSLPVLISLFQNGEWTLASTENWYIDARNRSYLVAHISPRTRQLTFHVVREGL